MMGSSETDRPEESLIIRTWQERSGSDFPRSVRLLKHASFEQVYQKGQRTFSGHMTVFFLRRESALEVELGRGPRVGFTVGRVLGGAVERNRIKRRMRSAVRQRLSMLDAPVDVVINPKKTVLTADFSKLVEEIERAFCAVVQRTTDRNKS